jgi:hypothetical protein
MRDNALAGDHIEVHRKMTPDPRRRTIAGQPLYLPTGPNALYLLPGMTGWAWFLRLDVWSRCGVEETGWPAGLIVSHPTGVPDGFVVGELPTNVATRGARSTWQGSAIRVEGARAERAGW